MSHTVRPAWASPQWTDEQFAIVARRRARRGVIEMCAAWRPEEMAIVTFYFLATGLVHRGRRSFDRRRRGWGGPLHPHEDRRSYNGDRRMP